LFHRAGDRWGLVNVLWRTADICFARGDPDGAEASLRPARTVLEETGVERWIAHTVAALAEAALLRGDADAARALVAEADALHAEAAQATTDGVRVRLATLREGAAKTAQRRRQ